MCLWPRTSRTVAGATDGRAPLRPLPSESTIATLRVFPRLQNADCALLATAALVRPSVRITSGSVRIAFRTGDDWHRDEVGALIQQRRPCLGRASVREPFRVQRIQDRRPFGWGQRLRLDPLSVRDRDGPGRRRAGPVTPVPAPFSPVAAASYSATTSSLYCAMNVRRRPRSGTSGSGRSCRSPVTRPASPTTWARPDTVIVVRKLSPFLPSGRSVITEGRAPHDSLAERRSSSSGSLFRRQIARSFGIGSSARLSTCKRDQYSGCPGP